MSRITRRRLLATATLAAGLPLARAARAATDRIDVAIVGAGLAGLNAALILADLGARVVVLEAATRGGGRCRTADGWHRRPELGAAQVGRDYARILDLANRLKVPLGSGAQRNAPYAFVVDGGLVPAARWPDSPRNRLVGAERAVAPHTLGAYYVEQRSPFVAADDWLQPAAAQFDLSLAEWLDRQQASPEARRIITVSQGAPLESLSLLRMFQEATRARLGLGPAAGTPGGKDIYERTGVTAYHVVGGTSRLTDAMAAALGDRVRLGQRVEAIELAADGATLRVAGQAPVRAHCVIAAVPFSVLRGIAVTPQLAGDQADAVARMPYGNQSQVWFRVTRPYWEADGVEASLWTDGTFTLVRQQIEPDGARELVSALAFGANSQRVDALPPAERGRLALAELTRARPSLAGSLEYVGAQSWEQEPTARGCSFRFLPGRAVAWQAAMARPHLNLHFAGEHLRQLDVGMEAAAESGERAAREVAERLAG
jgi:monoamine oxidase